MIKLAGSGGIRRWISGEHTHPDISGTTPIHYPITHNQGKTPIMWHVESQFDGLWNQIIDQDDAFGGTYRYGYAASNGSINVVNFYVNRSGSPIRFILFFD